MEALAEASKRSRTRQSTAAAQAVAADTSHKHNTAAVAGDDLQMAANSKAGNVADAVVGDLAGKAAAGLLEVTQAPVVPLDNKENAGARQAMNAQ